MGKTTKKAQRNVKKVTLRREKHKKQNKTAKSTKNN